MFKLCFFQCNCNGSVPCFLDWWGKGDILLVNFLETQFGLFFWILLLLILWECLILGVWIMLFFLLLLKKNLLLSLFFFILWEYRHLRIFIVLFLLDSTSFNSFWSICLWESYYWFSYTQHNCTSIVILLFIQLLLIFLGVFTFGSLNSEFLRKKLCLSLTFTYLFCHWFL